MNESSLRMTEPSKAPTPAKIKNWIGKDAYGFWTHITKYIEKNYPNVFAPEWLFGGKKHGWSLRYKKGRSFCTLIPEKNRFEIMIVFGREECAKVETIRKQISSRTMKLFDDAKTYHDGKWLRLAVDSNKAVADVELLLTAKRKPKK